MSINWKKFWITFGGSIAFVIVVAAVIAGISLVAELVHPIAGMSLALVIAITMVAFGASLER